MIIVSLLKVSLSHGQTFSGCIQEKEVCCDTLPGANTLVPVWENTSDVSVVTPLVWWDFRRRMLLFLDCSRHWRVRVATCRNSCVKRRVTVTAWLSRSG